jgi:hypothetical protein
MGIKAIVESLDEVEEILRPNYVQQGEKYYLTVEGLRPAEEVTRLTSALAKERNDHKEVRNKLQTFSSLGELDELQQKLDRITELETAAGGKLDEAALAKLVEGRLTSRTAPLERTITQLQNDLKERENILGLYKTKETQRTIHDALREAVKKQEGFQFTAFDDAALLAERIFEVTDDGRVAAKENCGTTPGIDPSVWLTEMQTRRPHWWGTTQGGGARGNSGGSAGGTNPWSDGAWNMTEQSKIYREDSRRAEQLAKSAGTTIGGPRPKK